MRLRELLHTLQDAAAEAAIGALLDDFEREALKQLRANAKVPYARFEVYDGRTSLRYTSPMLMERSCVTCHNTHPASPKKDWKVGDVRGVQEITMPLDRQIGEIKTGKVYGKNFDAIKTKIVS